MAKIGFALSEQFPAPQLIEYGVAAEQAGFDRVWFADHIHPWQDNQGHATSAWVAMAAFGQRSERITFGSGVTCPTYRYHPAVVAQTYATLGLLYPGRVFLGIGSGEALNEQSITGQWGPYEERAERFLEAIEIIRALYKGDWVEYQGKHFQVQHAKIYDLPSQPVPIYLAAEGPKAMRLAGKYGDGLITDAKSAVMPEMRQAFEQGAREAGKDPKQLPILAEHFVVVGGQAEAQEAGKFWRFIPKAWKEFVNNPDPRDIQRRAEAEVSDKELFQNWVISENPQEHADAIQKLFDGGVTEVYVHSGQLDQQRVISFFGEQVLPLLGSAKARER